METEKQTDSRPWLFKKGQSGNPGGKPKGTVSLKTFARNYLLKLSDEDKLKFMEGLPKEIIWKMSEGAPDTKNELNAKVEVTNDMSYDTAKSIIAGKASDTSDSPK